MLKAGEILRLKKAVTKKHCSGSGLWKTSVSEVLSRAEKANLS